MKKSLKDNEEVIDFDSCIKSLYEDNTVQQMADFPHHLGRTCMDHSLFVSYVSYLVTRKLGWDYVSAARGGLLHDLFLYDWRKEECREGWHGTSHPKIALKNAHELCAEKEGEQKLNSLEKDIILKHMWPLTFKKPSYKESFVVCLADKICALIELSMVYKLLKFKRTNSRIVKKQIVYNYS